MTWPATHYSVPDYGDTPEICAARRGALIADHRDDLRRRRAARAARKEHLDRMRAIWSEQCAARREALIADVEWIVGYDGAEETARRVGYEKSRSLARILHRAGRHDLAVLFDRVAS